MIDDSDTELFRVLDRIHDTGKAPDVNRIHQRAKARRSRQHVKFGLLGVALVSTSVFATGLWLSQNDDQPDSLVTADSEAEADAAEIVTKANQDDLTPEESELLTWIKSHDDPPSHEILWTVRVVAVDNDAEVNGLELDINAIPQSNETIAFETFVWANCGSLVSRGLLAPTDGSWRYLEDVYPEEGASGVGGPTADCDAFDPPLTVLSLWAETFDIEMEGESMTMLNGSKRIDFIVTIPDEGIPGFPDEE